MPLLAPAGRRHGVWSPLLGHRGALGEPPPRAVLTIIARRSQDPASQLRTGILDVGSVGPKSQHGPMGQRESLASQCVAVGNVAPVLCIMDLQFRSMYIVGWLSGEDAIFVV